MMLSTSKMADWMDGSESQDDPLVVTPLSTKISELRSNHSASLDLRLGTWFLSKKARNWSMLNVYEKDDEIVRMAKSSMSSAYFVPFSKQFILHPNSFVLGVTLEWIRVPSRLAAMVTGRSAWGRRGLIVETAPGVHPGFSGCLTLEMTNVGDVPIAIMPGENICQLFLYKLDGGGEFSKQGQFFGQRKPSLGALKPSGIHAISPKDD